MRTYIVGQTGVVTGNIPRFRDTNGAYVEDSGYSIAAIIAAAAGASGDVDGPAVAVNNDLAVFDGTTGKLIKDSGTTVAALIASAVAAAEAASGDVDGPAGATNNDIAVFDGVTGKLIKDSGTTVAAVIASAVASAVATAEAASQPLDSDLTAVAGLSATGLIARTGTGSAAVRTVTGTAGQIAVANGDGVAGNPTASLVDTAVTPGTYGDGTHVAAVTIDQKGRITAASQVAITGSGGSGDVVGPGVAVNDDIALFSGTTGKLIKDSGFKIADLQPIDSDLTALAALGTTGLIARTGAGTVAARTITAGAGITLTDGDGVAGNPTVSADFYKFAETVLGADTATVAFNTIPGTYRSIMVTVQVRNDNAASGATDGYMQFNGDTAANYSRSFGAWTGTAVNSGQTISAAKCPAFFAINNGAAAGLATVLTITIYNYARTDWKKMATSIMGIPLAISSGNLQGNTISFFWNSSAAITDILLGMTDTSKFKTGSVFTCYLLK
jgi:hypothetical protein